FLTVASLYFLSSLAFTASPVRTRSSGVFCRAAPDKVEVVQNVALGAAYASTFLKKDDSWIASALPMID
ncbi:unnamed protein product, partial [Symbiodinium natans]